MRTEDLTGKTFGELTVILKYPYKDKNGSTMWICKCSCGKEIYVRHLSLTCGNTKLCGHTRLANLKTHGEFGTRLYSVWNKMKHRCLNPNDLKFKHYGGRGIKVCDEWMQYVNFRDWAMSNGYDPNAPYGKCTIDRIDVNGDYCPENCRWVDMKTQANNKRFYHNQYTNNA